MAKREVQAALREAWRLRKPAQDIEDCFRPMVPGVGELYGTPFWNHVAAYMRIPSVYGMQRREFNDLTPEELFPHLSLVMGVSNDRSPRAARGRSGRPKGTTVDGTKLRKLRGSFSQADFAAKCDPPLSEDTIQRGEGGARWPEGTFKAVVKGLTDMGVKVTSEDLKDRKNRTK